MECEWVIMASHGNHVKFNFDTFEIEDESDCGSVMSLNFNSIFCIRKKPHENIKQIIYLFKESNHFPWDINTMYMYKNNLLVNNEMRVIINLNVCLQ